MGKSVVRHGGDVDLEDHEKQSMSRDAKTLDYVCSEPGPCASRFAT
jgi:hypothetical protein